ncbi:MAG: hypothetical protein V4627_16320 [Pseudomonadota bacterium]
MSASLVGCNQISAVLTASDDKINTAFPVADVTKTAYSTLLASFEEGSPERKSVADEHAKLMSVRALTCTAKTPIGRWDTVSKIKAKITDTDCFQKQDARLAEWIGLQRLSQALSRPALVALTVLPDKALLPNFSEFSGQLTVAAEANVMVVKGAQKFIAVELPSGKVINSFAIPEQTYRPAMVSANGHVLAVPVGSRNLRMVEVQSGNLLWSTEEFSDLIAWLPQVQAALLTQVGGGSAQMLDIKNGKTQAFPSTEKRLTWALPIKAASGRYLVGEGHTVSQMDIVRTDRGVLESAPVQQWRLNGSGISHTGAFLMDNGTKLVYQSGLDLAWVNLADQQQGVWQLSALGGYGFTKINEKAIVFDASAMGTTPPGTRVLNIDDSTIAVANNTAMRDGPLTPLLPRSGYLRRSDSSVTIGTAAETEAPLPLDKVVSEALLASQLAKLAAMSNAESTTPSNPYYEALSKQVRAANVMSAVRDGLPREVIESIRDGSRYANNTPAKPVKPLLTDVPSNARVSVVGVYEGTNSSATKSASHSPGSVRINVQPGSTPLVLVLTSYEPVNWLINTNGRKISRILTSGYYDSTVIGADSTPVIKIGSKYAYKLDSNEYTQLKQDIARYIENSVYMFQGSYTGREFSVN